MDYVAYQQLFENILSGKNLAAPYDDVHYFDYTKLNHSRMRRWDKTLKLDAELIDELQKIQAPQTWIIITEPWCGDAAHNIPFMVAMAAQNAFITIDIQLRDSAPFLIENYLTRGTKSIPKLIGRDKNGRDLFTWGPRPVQAQQLYDQLRADVLNLSTLKVKLQEWYNQNKGVDLCQEITALLKAVR